MKIFACSDCGEEFADLRPRKAYKCLSCGRVNPPRKVRDIGIQKGALGNPRRECVCCGRPGTKSCQIEGSWFLLCGLCDDFGKSFTSRESFAAYRKSGGASTWLMAGKRLLHDNVPPGTVQELKERDVPKLPDLTRKPGSYQGGVPFGYRLDGKNLVEDEAQQVTLNLIQTYLKRRLSLAAIARILVQTKRTNKRGQVSWHPSMVKFLAERERFI